MRTKLFRRGIPLIAFMCFACATAPGQASPFRIEIQLAQPAAVGHEDFQVSTAIFNIGNNEQQLQIFSCSYDQQWTADNPVVHIRIAPCKKDDIIQIALKPGEAYRRTLSAYVSLEAVNPRPASVTFRLRYKSAMQTPASSLPPAWSNALSADVAR